jgi:redox-sensitive bicupin YhaK (pirin superfamily)
MTSTLRRVRRVISAVMTNEGVGAKVARSIGSSRDVDELDPFLMLDEFFVQKPAGFPNHPHRGFMTLTYMMDGAFEHEDNHGHKGVIREGDIQWMIAGRGIIHSEMPVGDGVNHGLQLWVNLPAAHKMQPAQYREHTSSELPEVQSQDKLVSCKIVSGSAMGAKAPFELPIPILFVDYTLKGPGAKVEQPIDPTHIVFLYVLEGAVRINGQKRVKARDWVEFEMPSDASADKFTIEFDEGYTGKQARFAVVAGKPIGERVVKYGPFVMNTEDEIEQAIMDYRSGRF